MTPYKTRVALFVSVALVLLGNAPLRAVEHWQGSLSFSTGFPTGEHRDYQDRTGFGLTMNGALRLGESPVLLGAEFGVLNFGVDHRSGEIVPYHYPVDLEDSYNLVQGNLFLRLQPARGNVRPYVDFLVGLNYLWSETEIDRDDWWDDEVWRDEYSHTNLDDTAINYGIGAGVQVDLSPRRERDRRRVRDVNVFLDLKARYLLGGKAEYLTKGAMVMEGDELVYYVSESRTHLFTVQLGLGLSFR